MYKIRIIKNILLAKLKDQPYKLNFAITSRCNSRCKTCNVWKNDRKEAKTQTKDRKEKELSIKEIDKIFKNMPDTITWLSLSGGEPFLRQDLEKIVKSAKEKFPRLQIVSIPSNGLAKENILKTTKRLLKIGIPKLILTFSIDGPPEVHDKIRGIKKGFKKTWNTYNNIKKISKKNKNLNVFIETNISTLNIDHIEGFLKNLIKKNDITLTIAHTGYLYKKDKKDDEYVLRSKDIKKITRIIKIKNSSLSIISPKDFIEKRYLKNIPKYLKDQHKFNKICTALNKSITIDSFGNITPCFMWGNKLGNLRDLDYDIKKIWNSKKRKKALANIKNKGCPGCWTPCEAYHAIINDIII